MSVWRKSSSVATAGNASHLFVLCVDQLESFQSPLALSGTARLVWDLLDGIRSDADISKDIAIANDLDQDVIEHDVHVFMERAREYRLVEEC